jgi:hypothetical protein
MRCEVAPPADPMLSGPIHQMALVVHGVHLLEHLKLDELAAKGVYEFAFMMQPLKLQGATRLDRGSDRSAIRQEGSGAAVGRARTFGVDAPRSLVSYSRISLTARTTPCASLLALPLPC